MQLKPVGYDALVKRYGLNPIPHWCVSHVAPKGDRKTVVTPDLTSETYPARYDPGDSVGGHLEFALKYEGVNLEILRAVFRAAEAGDLTAYVRGKPSGKYARRAWFLYELMTGKRLDLPNLAHGNYVDLLEPDRYYVAPSVRSRRHRINNNLPGEASFCPLVRRTESLRKYESRTLDKKARALLRRYPEDLLRRAVSYLYTKETRSSFAIEHVEPSAQRTARFVALLRRAGKDDHLNKPALIALQRAIVDERFAGLDYRDFQNYVGESFGTNRELVHFVAPKPEDLPELMEGWLQCSRRMLDADIHAVVTATVAAFGFVFLHPFEDGNGRLHRFLIHHVLARKGFTPAGIVFPVSAAMLRQMDKYDETLECFSRPLLERIEYRLNPRGEMTVLTETADFYRYPDMTRIAERLFEFVEATIEGELVGELDFLARHDRIKRGLQEIVDMPDRRLDLFIRLCLQNKGRLAKDKRGQFAGLTDDEVAAMETVVQARTRGGSTVGPARGRRIEPRRHGEHGGGCLRELAMQMARARSIVNRSRRPFSSADASSSRWTIAGDQPSRYALRLGTR